MSAKYAIRIRKRVGQPWQRGRQYWRRSPGSRWRFWRDTYPSRKVAEHRLKQLTKRGWSGHVYQVDPDGYRWLELDSDTRMPHPNLARILNQAGRMSGRVLRINEGTRTRAQQQAFWDANPNTRYVARPGTSNHEDQNGDGYGVAADVVDARDGENLYPMLRRRRLIAWLESQGAFFPMPHEPWHIELKDVPR